MSISRTKISIPDYTTDTTNARHGTCVQTRYTTDGSAKTQLFALKIYIFHIDPFDSVNVYFSDQNKYIDYTTSTTNARHGTCM